MATLYFVIIMLASLVGLITGVGGGVIIKPVLDLLHYHPIRDINVYSSLAVITMSLLSVSRKKEQLQQINRSYVILIGAGSILGGYVGSFTLGMFYQMIDPKTVLMIQSISTAILLAITLFITSKHISIHLSKHSGVIGFLGLILGSVSAFLGIGGGPFNMLVFKNFFNFSFKESALYSIIVILLSQSTNLMTTLASTGVGVYDMFFVGIVIVSALLGSILGNRLESRFHEDHLHKLLNWLLFGLVVLNLINFLRII